MMTFIPLYCDYAFTFSFSLQPPLKLTYTTQQESKNILFLYPQCLAQRLTLVGIHQILFNE